MPRVTFVKAARKDNPICKAGESYYWWKFRHGGKRYSLTRPRGSQLTQSAYYSGVRSLVEQIEDWFSNPDLDGLESLATEIADALRQLGQEAEESRENMPESLQDSPTGELLQERYDICESQASELECIDFEFESEFDDYDEDVTDQDRTDEKESWLNDRAEEFISYTQECEV